MGRLALNKLDTRCSHLKHKCSLASFHGVADISHAQDTK